jgi:toxin-antitoxin system PIN domain toxin
MPTTASPYDTGVSLALAFASHPFHQKARAVFEPADSCQPAAFCRATQATFLRLLTVKSICDAHGCDTIPNSKAWAKCAELLHLPQVTWLEEPSEVELEWGNCATLNSAPQKIWMDAYLPAFAIRSGISLVSIDSDFVRVEPQGLQFRLLPRDRV